MFFCRSIINSRSSYYDVHVTTGCLFCSAFEAILECMYSEIEPKCSRAAAIYIGRFFSSDILRTALFSNCYIGKTEFIFHDKYVLSNHGLWGSNKLLYKQYAKSMGTGKFCSLQLWNLGSDRFDHRTCQTWERWDWRGVANTQFVTILGEPFVFCILCSPSWLNRWTECDVWGLKTRVFGQGSAFWSLDDEK